MFLLSFLILFPRFMAALRNRAALFIFVLWFFLSIFLFFFYLFSSPVLSRPRLDVYHTSTRGVALVSIWDAGLKRAACGSLKIQDAKIAISAPSHSFVGPYLRKNQGTFDKSEKKLVNSNTSSTCLHNTVNFGPLTAEIR